MLPYLYQILPKDPFSLEVNVNADANVNANAYHAASIS